MSLALSLVWDSGDNPFNCAHEFAPIRQFEVLSLSNRKKCQTPFFSLAQIVSKYSPISSRNDYFLSANTLLVKDQQARQELKPSCHTVKTSWAETLIFFFLYPVHNVCCCNLSGGLPPVNVVTPFTREGVCSASALDADSTSRDRTSPGQRGYLLHVTGYSSLTKIICCTYWHQCHMTPCPYDKDVGNKWGRYVGGGGSAWGNTSAMFISLFLKNHENV